MSKTNTSKKSPAVQAAPTDPTKNDDAKPVIRHAYWLLKAGVAAKIGKQAHGGLSYQILGDVDRQSLHIAITANDGGGYFSRELVPFAKVQACLSQFAPGQPFPSKSMQNAFRGRSSNNAPFLSAILRAVSFLARAPDNETLHVVAEDWEVWQKAMLAEAGRMIEIELAAPDTAPSDDTSDLGDSAATKASKTLTIKRPKTEVSEDVGAGPGHASPD